MKLSWKWLTPMLLRLMALSQASLISSMGNLERLGSVHLVASVTIGLASSPTQILSTSLLQPSRPRVSLDGTTYIQLSGRELSLPIMPLHLLGKKSWNVYNQDNIDKVRRDEAAARAKEEAEEQLMQERDAERRMQTLRGEVPSPLPIQEERYDESNDRDPSSHGGGRERKKRKRAGENDTDFEMRMAKHQTQPNPDTQIVLRKPTSDLPLTDNAGNIDLFPQLPVAKNPEAEKEAARKKKEYEDQFTMRFSNAAGFKQGLDNPWYSRPTVEEVDEESEAPGKDVWGNEDPRRKDREAARLVSNDPLAFMRQGAAKVRQVERERKAWNEEREREMRDLMKEESKERKRKRQHDDTEDDLESFTLDGQEKRPRGSYDYERRSHKRSHRDRSHDREHDRHRRHRRH